LGSSFQRWRAQKRRTCGRSQSNLCEWCFYIENHDKRGLKLQEHLIVGLRKVLKELSLGQGSKKLDSWMWTFFAIMSVKGEKKQQIDHSQGFFKCKLHVSLISKNSVMRLFFTNLAEHIYLFVCYEFMIKQTHYVNWVKKFIQKIM
jgi:hypothetical protein